VKEKNREIIQSGLITLGGLGVSNIVFSNFKALEMIYYVCNNSTGTQRNKGIV
jgi:hypothetical protein